MNRFKVGAAALLLGSSALAGVALAQDPYGGADVDAAKRYDTTMNGGFGPVLAKDAAPLSKAAAYTDWGNEDAGKMGGGAGDQYAQADPQATPPADPLPPEPTVPVDQTDPVATGDAAGTGAPVDTMDTTTTVGEATTTSAPVQTAALDLTPRPATQNYPACEPGPGDDSCIQLYERGVRTALASWTQPTGGHGDGAVQTAMGGPEEPGLDAHQSDTMTAESTSHAMPAEAPIETATADDPDPAVPAAGNSTAYTGVGGPVSETGYPACEPGPGDDRCIQLYERGVTGEGN